MLMKKLQNEAHQQHWSNINSVHMSQYYFTRCQCDSHAEIKSFISVLSSCPFLMGISCSAYKRKSTGHKLSSLHKSLGSPEEGDNDGDSFLRLWAYSLDETELQVYSLWSVILCVSPHKGQSVKLHMHMYAWPLISATTGQSLYALFESASLESAKSSGRWSQVSGQCLCWVCLLSLLPSTKQE